MSVFMHDTAHVDAIVHAAITANGSLHRWIEWEDESGALVRLGRDRLPTEVGQMLLRANAEAMADRYNMKDLASDADGGTRPLEYLSYLEQASQYEYDMFGSHRQLNFGEVLAAIDGLMYQLCECVGVMASEVPRFLEAVERVVLRSTCEYVTAETRQISDPVSAAVGARIEAI